METNMSREELLDLLMEHDPFCLSIYMPMSRTGAEGRRDIVRFKNCLGQAEKQLIDMGMRRPEARDYLAPASRLLEQRAFLQHRGDGFALFRSAKRFRIMQMPLRFQKRVVVGHRFYIKPLLRLFNEKERFFLLAVSGNSCRLFKGTRDGLIPVTVEGMPDGIAEALRYNDPEKQLQFHTKTGSRPGDRSAVYHGQGVGKDDAIDNTRRYLHQVDRAIHGILTNENASLLFTGVGSIFAMYRDLTEHDLLLDEYLPGNPDELKPHELHHKAWPLIAKKARLRIDQALSRYREFVGTDKASSDLRVILPSAYSGRVDTLFASVNTQEWGRFLPAENKVILHQEREQGDEDLIDLAAAYTLARGGTVYVFEEDDISVDSPTACLFRY